MNQPSHIPVIEDDPAVARSLQDGLVRDGYTVTWKNTGAQGVAFARDFHPHLIILDVRLPDGSGFDFCRQIRKLGLRQPILILTVQREEIDLEAPHGNKNSAPVDLVDLVRQLAQVYASQAEQADIAFQVDLPDRPVVVSGDEQQIGRAVGNLLENALKFTPPQGSVRVAISQDQNVMSVSVSDTGIGIPPEDVPQLFNRFHRGRNATAYPGSGLGLAIVKAIADENGAEVVVENLAPGARFTLRWCEA